MPCTSSFFKINQVLKDIRVSCKKDYLEFIDYLLCLGDNGVTFNDVTYAELLIEITNSTLKTGSLYRITDFRTRQIVPVTLVINDGPVEPLIVRALDVNVIGKEAFSGDNAFDIIHYSVNDITDGADMGRIIYRKDCNQELETWYDWRVYLYERWEDAAGNLVEVTPNANPQASLFTFGNSTSGGTSLQCSVGKTTSVQTNLVIGDGCQLIRFDPENIESTILDGCVGFDIGGGGADNVWFGNNQNFTWGVNCLGQRIGDGCSNFIWGHNHIGNVFGVDNVNFFWDNESFDNVFADNNFEVVFQNNVHESDVGSSNGDLFFENGCGVVTIGDNNETVTAKQRNETLTIGSSNQLITIGQGSSDSVIGDGNAAVTFEQGIEEADIGNDNANIYLAQRSSQSIIGSSNFHIRFEQNTVENTVGNNCLRVHLLQFVQESDIGDGSVDINIGQQGQTNTFLNGCSSITLDTTNVDHIFDGCSHISVGISSVELQLTNVINATFATNNSVHIINDSSNLTFGQSNTEFTIDTVNGVTVHNNNEIASMGSGSANITVGNGNENTTIGTGCNNITVHDGLTDLLVRDDSFNRNEWLHYGEMQAIYDVAIHGGAVGNNPFANIEQETYVFEQWWNAKTSPTSAGAATLGFGVDVDGPDELVSSVAIANAKYNGSIQMGDPDNAVGDQTTTSTARRDLIAVVGAFDLTGGVFQFNMRYYRIQ